MRPKILIVAGLVLAFFVGTMANGIYSATTQAFNPTDENAIASRSAAPYAPVVHRTHLVQPAVQTRTVYVSDAAPVYSSAPVYRTSVKKRSLGREALIVGGSAGAGAAIGAVAGGKKGAGIGALSGGIAGLVYDLATRNK